MKICVIGNSHTASLKLGWDEIAAANPKIKVTFFAGRGKITDDLQVKSGLLKRKILISGSPRLKRSLEFTSGGKDSINFADYDVCVIHGMIRFSRYDRRISGAVHEAIMQRTVIGSLATNIAKKVRECSDIPLWISHQPVQRMRDGELVTSLENYTSYDAVLADIKAAFPVKDVNFLKQSRDTLESEIATKAEFSQGSVRLDVGDKHSNKPHDLEDYVHMNGAFGIRVLENIFKAVGA